MGFSNKYKNQTLQNQRVAPRCPIFQMLVDGSIRHKTKFCHIRASVRHHVAPHPMFMG